MAMARVLHARGEYVISLDCSHFQPSGKYLEVFCIYIVLESKKFIDDLDGDFFSVESE